MNSIFYSVITLLLLTCGVLLLMRSANKNRYAEDVNAQRQPEMLSKEEGEDHFSALMNSITPVWYWRVNHEYIDFIHSTVKRMTMVELNETPGLFDAQRRCSDLNSAVYKYYDNIKKRCLSGRKSRTPIWMCLTCGSASGSSAWKPILHLSHWYGRNTSVR